MTSKPDLEAESRGADTPQDPNRSEDDIVEITRSEDERQEEDKADKASTDKPSLPEREKSPAYVSPIPAIPQIPPINPAMNIHVPPGTRPTLPEFVGTFLEGKRVDESGEIVDDRTDQVLAVAAGDLPSMVGRVVSNRQGDILGDDGELLGYVADIAIGRRPAGGAMPGPQGQTQSLHEYMGRNVGAFRVDHLGNILDATGNIVGRFQDNNNPLHRYIREEEEKNKKRTEQQAAGANDPEEGENREPEEEADGGGSAPPKRENAASYRKEDDSPSDIFLDVKSTRDGIQLTIRIPTVFNGQQFQPRVNFS